MSVTLTQLSALSIVTADTADYHAIKKYKVSEATTNPSIILQVATLPEYKHHIEKSVEYGLNTGKTYEEIIENSMDMINISFGEEILKVISNKVHLQIDPRLAFDTKKSVDKALKLVRLLEKRGMDKTKFVIKLPATWEGIKAAEILENNHNVNCNMTTMFSLLQAAACAEAGVSYLAPFVGRIGIWYENKSKTTNGHPGVTTLKLIQNYIKTFGYKTKVMGAYFVNIDEVKAVAGCDLATIPIELLEKLSKVYDTVSDMIDKTSSKLPVDKIILNEKEFRSLINADEMVTELLTEVIKNFTHDFIKLEDIVKDLVVSYKNKV